MPESVRRHHDYWDSFYESRVSRDVPMHPSAFARWVQEQLRSDQPVVELGFGNARDSLWFARLGHRVSGFDFAEIAVEHARGQADAEGVPASFEVLDLYDSSSADRVAKEIGQASDAPAVYGRFLIHTLEEVGRTNLLNLAAASLTDGGEFYLEFRTGQDQGTRHLFGEDHFRVYLDPAVVIHEIEDRGGTILHAAAGYGLAVFGTEDPHVARTVARWSA